MRSQGSPGSVGRGGKVGRIDVAVGVGAAVGVGGGVAGIGVAVCVGGGAAVAAGEGVGTLRAGGAGEDVAGAADCGRSDVGATAGATGPAGAPEPGGGPGSVGVTGAATCAVALGVGLMGAGWLPCGVDVPRACGPTSTVNAKTTAASPANATVSRAKRNVYATATLGTRVSGSRPAAKVRASKAMPATAAMATGLRSSLGRSTRLPTIVPIVAAKMISRSCPSVLITIVSTDAPSSLPTQPARPLPIRCYFQTGKWTLDTEKQASVCALISMCSRQLHD